MWLVPDNAEALHPTAVRVWWALTRMHTLQGRGTIQDVCDLLGLTSKATVWHHLETLEAAGLAERFTPVPLWRSTFRVVAEG